LLDEEAIEECANEEDILSNSNKENTNSIAKKKPKK
jgi:hypothetical protein